MSTNQDRPRGASLQRPLPANQLAGLSAPIKLALAMAPTATLARAQDPAPLAPAPLPDCLSETPAHGQAWTRPATSHRRRFAVFAVLGTAGTAAGAALQAILQDAGLAGYAALGIEFAVMIQVMFAANRIFTWRERKLRLAIALAKWNTQRTVVAAGSLGAYWVAVKYGHLHWLFANLVIVTLFTSVEYTVGHVRSFAPAGKHWQERKRPLRERLRFLTREPWPLLGILVVQAVLSLRLVRSNTAFGDEALYLWSGHVEWAHWLHGTSVPNFAAYFSGAPVVYPPVGAVADSIGGLAAARILSMIFMLVSTVFLYLTARMLLLDKRAAVYAAAAFGLLGPTVSLAFATHDAMALMLMALSAWLAVHASGRHPEPFLLLAGVVMALANAAKYASALWDPAVIAAGIAASWHAGPWIRMLRGIRVAIYAGCVLGVALFRFGGPVYEHGVLVTTLARASGTTPPASVLGDSFNYISPVIIVSLLAVISSRRASRRIRFLCISVTVSCWLAPVNQARIHTLTSLHKHVDFGAWFAAIAVGYVISQASGLQHERSWRIAIALAAVIPLTLVSFNVSGNLYRWAPAARMVARLEPLLHKGHAHYLMDPQSANIVYYYLHAEVYPGQLSLLQCTWWDPARHRELRGPRACTAAIKAHYYELIETDDAANGPRGTPAEVAVWKAIRASGAYRLIYHAHQLYHPEDLFQIWQLRKPRGTRHVARAQR